MSLKKTIFLITIYFLFGSVTLLAQTKIDASFTFQSTTKNYSLLVPASYTPSKRTKVMVGMHPYNTSRWDAKSWRDTLAVFANTNNLLLVCPDGGANGSIIDNIDTAFTTALIDSVFNWYNVDSSQIYITGFSYGGKATYLYGLEHPEIFAGFMPIGAATSLIDLPQRRRNNAVCKPVAIIHGGNDSPNSRFYPMKDTLKNYTNYVWDTLMPSVGHTIDFANRNQILTMAFNYIDSINNLAVSMSLGKDVFQCGTDSVNLGANLTTSGGRCSYKYTWTPSTGLNDATIANPKAMVSSNTTYILKVTDADGNSSASDTIQVIIKALPNVSLGNDDTICQNVGRTFTANGAKTYSWLPTSGLSCSNCASPSIRIAKKATYFVTGTDSFGCIAVDTLNVGVYISPTIKTSNDTSMCFGDTIKFKTTGAKSYSWQSQYNLSDSTIADPLFFSYQGNINITHIVTGIDSNGCSGIDFVRVRVHSLPIIKASADTTICFGEAVNLSATGGLTYNWSDSTYLNCSNCETPTFTGKVFSHFPYKLLVEGKDNFHCVGYDTVSVTVRRPVSISTSSNDTICSGDFSYLVVRAGGKIKWLNSSTLDCDTCISPRATPISTTTYQVKVTDMYSCTDTAEVVVAVNSLPTTTFRGDTLICKGDTGTILLTSTGTIKWLTTTNINDVTSLAPKVWPTKSGAYRLVATTKENCSAQDSVFLEVQNPIADFTINGSGATKSFDKSASKDYDTFSYNYNGSPGNAGTDSFEFTKNGSYSICLTVNTDEGCKNETCKNIEIRTVGIEGLNGVENPYLVFPNPVSNQFKIEDKNQTISSIEIFNLQSKTVFYSKEKPEYNITSLPTGNYILQITSDEGIERFPLVKIEAR